ncbi:hypothetical protein J7E96_22060 [Streptomyces sp. ISL-96]|uniref:hypothetical protein n=1 Tax=Streptomyces sp. ISL-96 TaxID=2819191 RepID=UPI001BEC58BC|nr:hypothetical protein [Streptomyces sp. ISL-96]MBT2491158.1 hypothetical protein [Streptomyces sp. ISL-96]
MSNGMRVDLSALDEVVSKLRRLLDDMDKADGKAKYDTFVPASAFGHPSFLEGGGLFQAHEKMKTDLEMAIKGLRGLIDEFGTSTSKVRGKYAEQEYANKQGMGGGSDGSGEPKYR